jgi:hypothetical protein
VGYHAEVAELLDAGHEVRKIRGKTPSYTTQAKGRDKKSGETEMSRNARRYTSNVSVKNQIAQSDIGVLIHTLVVCIAIYVV